MTEAVQMLQPFPQPSNPNSAGPSNSRIPEHCMYKNRLQEYAQSRGIPLPVYHTINEGAQHAPRFRSTVMIAGATYRSAYTFNHRKSAEQDVAKLALDQLSRRLPEQVGADEGFPLIREDTVFCKSILYEYAVKMKVDRPIYTTSQTEGGLLPVFVSSLTFDGKSYTGMAGRNKKEAEQMAARTAIISILGNPGSKTHLSQIIKSKIKLYAALHKVNESVPPLDANVAFGGQLGSSSENPLSKGKEIEIMLPTENTVTKNLVLKRPKQEVFCEGSSVLVGCPIPVLNEKSAGGPAGSTRLSGTVAHENDPLHHNQLGNEVPFDAVVTSDSQERKRPRKKNKKGRPLKKICIDEPNDTPEAHPAQVDSQTHPASVP